MLRVFQEDKITVTHFYPGQDQLLWRPIHRFLFRSLKTCSYGYNNAAFLKLENEGGADLGGGCWGCAPPPPLRWPADFQYNWYSAKKTMWFISVEVEQETSAPPPKKILDPPLWRFSKRAWMEGQSTKKVFGFKMSRFGRSLKAITISTLKFC